MCYSIKDETLKKYVLEDFLEKIKKLTPIQNARQSYQRFQKYVKNQNHQILNETKNLHHKNIHFSKIQIKEFSVLFIMLNYLEVALKKIEELSELVFFSNENENLKKLIISLLAEGKDKEAVKSIIEDKFKRLIQEIKVNSSIQIIAKEKNEQAILDLLNELLIELKDLNNLKKIESLEKELINNMDENSYSELVKLKNQLNRE